jgi:hypothetical protein
MRRKPDARALLFERIRTSPPKFVHVTGVPYAVQLEQCTDPTQLDHVWLTIEAPPFGRLRVVVNSTSRIARDAGFDPNIRIGTLRTTWAEKPTPGLVEADGFRYDAIELTHKIEYVSYDRDALAELLMVKAKAAIRVEVWGDLYARDHLGIHQIHSRRASDAVPQDIKNRDGALRFYYAEDNVAELLLLKFSGQP